jgi:hypothetical protein
MVLSQENYDRLNINFLYKKEPVVDESYHIGSIPGTYWCKNWTFRVKKLENGKAFMYDTYWNSFDHSIEVIDENIDEFEVVFDFREVRQIYDSEVNEYNEEDLYRVATDSGGYTCGKLHWIKKGTEKSKDLLIKKKRDEIESLKLKLEWAERDLEKLME